MVYSIDDLFFSSIFMQDACKNLFWKGSLNMSEKKSHLEGKKILAVHDEKEVLEVIEKELEMAEVDTALDYQTASEKISQNDYDLAILDIIGVNGLTLLEKAVAKKIPTIMLTANALNYEKLMHSIRKGSISFLPKEKLPFNPWLQKRPSFWFSYIISKEFIYFFRIP